MENFNYLEAVKRLEELAAKAEDPSTGLEEIDKCIMESDRLVAGCRAYLRSARQKTESIDQ